MAKFLFQNSKLPFDILGQAQCGKIETSRGKFLHHPKDTYKLIYLKLLADQIFSHSSGGASFSKENTLLIDYSPEKSVCNEIGNAIFLQPWEHRLRGDEFLMGSLVHWLRQLHEDCDPGPLQQYV